MGRKMGLFGRSVGMPGPSGSVGRAPALGRAPNIDLVRWKVGRRLTFTYYTGPPLIILHCAPPPRSTQPLRPAAARLLSRDSRLTVAVLCSGALSINLVVTSPYTREVVSLLINVSDKNGVFVFPAFFCQR